MFLFFLDLVEANTHNVIIPWQPDAPYTFEDFVEALDENDRFTQRLVEFLVKVCVKTSSCLIPMRVSEVASALQPVVSPPTLLHFGHILAMPSAATALFLYGRHQ